MFKRYPPAMVCLLMFHLLPVLPAQAQQPAAEEATPSAANREWRREALNRQRRIIFDNDGNEPIYAREPTAEALLELRCKGLEGSHVDTIVYCTTNCFGTTNRVSKEWSAWTVRAEPHMNNQLERVLAAGIDPLAVVVDFGHRNGMEVFHGIRMNDVHDSSLDGYGKVRFLNNPLKSQHPEWLMGTAQKRLKHGGWSAVDYARPEVRESLFQFAREGCVNYDVDGMHLDFFRHPVFFRSNTQGKNATEEEREAMTGLMRRLRAMADQVGKERGRPILISIRVPDSVEYCRAIGLDLERWLAEDLCDMMSVASYFQLNEWSYSAELGQRYGVKVYPSLDESRVRDLESPSARNSNLAYRARAANVWQAGAAGVLLFNAFDPRDPMWNELGDPQKLASLDKDYYASERGIVQANKGNLPFTEYQQIETLNPAHPKRIAPGESATAVLTIGDERGGDGQSRPTFTLRVRVANGVAPDQVRLAINGHEVEGLARDGEWLATNIDPRSVGPQSLGPGQNKVALALDKEAKKPIDWTDLMLTVRE